MYLHLIRPPPFEIKGIHQTIKLCSPCSARHPQCPIVLEGGCAAVQNPFHSIVKGVGRDDGKRNGCKRKSIDSPFFIIIIITPKGGPEASSPFFFLIPVTIEEEEDGKENNKKRRERVSFLCVEWLMKEAVPLYSTAPAGSAATHSLLCVL